MRHSCQSRTSDLAMAACSGCDEYLRNELLAKEDASDISTDVASSDSDSEPEVREDTLIIFDWDDSLFPTTWLERNGLLQDDAALSQEELQKLERLADAVAETLRTARLRRSGVVIVTNAAIGWVEASCARFMPSLYPTLSSVKIVSARSAYEERGVGHNEWKCHAFADEVKLFYEDCPSGSRRNIISVGDALYEHRALNSVTQGVVNCIAKFVKLIECPDVEQLIDEHTVIGTSLPDIVDHDDDLDMEIGIDDL